MSRAPTPVSATTPSATTPSATTPPATTPPPAAVLRAFLARTVNAGEARDWVLRGSVVTRAYHANARAPMDLDYLVCTETFEPGVVEANVRRLLDPERAISGDSVRFSAAEMRTMPIWEETDFPGLRVFVPAALSDDEALSGADDEPPAELRIDFGFGDPMAAPVSDIAFQGVAPLRAVARETMVAWKIHGLVEWGRGRWRPKDLADLHVLLSEPLDERLLPGALELAFSSRKTELSALADLIFRPSWGESSGRRKRWRRFSSTHPGAPDFREAKARVLALLERLGVPARLASHTSVSGHESGRGAAVQ